jgi:hypothetical protein
MTSPPILAWPLSLHRSHAFCELLYTVPGFPPALNAGATGVLKEPFTLQSFRVALNKLAPSDTELFIVRAGISILSF